MSNKDRQARYNAKNTRVEIVFNSDNQTDQALLQWLDKLRLELEMRSHSQVIKSLVISAKKQLEEKCSENCETGG